MLRVAVVAIVAVLGFATSGCRPSLTPQEGRAELARRLVTRECRDGSPQDRAARVAALRGVDRVESLVQERGQKLPTRLLVGVRVALIAAENVSPPHLEHDIECHEADVVLGRVALDEADPFVLPDEWVDARVHTEGTRVMIDLHPATEDGATATLGRAKRFAALRLAAE